MAKKIYKVVKREVSTAYVFVEAESKDKAQEIVDGLEHSSFTENQDYDSTFNIKVALPDELWPKQYIETETGVRRYDNSPV